MSVVGCTPRSRWCTVRNSCCSTSRPPAPTCGPAARSCSSSARARRRRLGGRVLDALPPRDRGARAPAIAFIDHGRIVARGELAELVRRYGSERARADVRRRRSRLGGVDGAVVDGSSVRDPDRRPGRRWPRAAAASSARHGRSCAGSRSSAPASSRCSSRSPAGATTRAVGAGGMSSRPAHRRDRRPRARGSSRRDPLPLMVLVVFPIITIAFLKPAFRPRSCRAGIRTRTAPSRSCPAKPR